MINTNTISIAPGTRVLFANFPADGHFNPLTGLAIHLKNLGCDVRWYTSRKYEAKIQKLDIPFYPLKKAMDFAVHPDIDAVFPERKKRKSQISKLKFDMVHAFILRAPEYYADIQDIHASFPFEIMIADVTFGGIPFVKELMNIPVIAVNVIPLPETSRDLPPTGLGMTPSYTRLGRLRQHLLRFVADRILFAGPTKVMTRILAAHGIDAGGSNIFDIIIKKSTVALQSGTPGFEYHRSDISSKVVFAGPLLPHSRKKSGKSWYHEKLTTYDKVILVTQGTVETDVEKLLVPTLEAFKDSSYLVVATTGGSQTAALRARYPQGNIIIEDFIPFEDIMPFASVYVTNGGYGGVLLSIQNQLPMVVAGIHEGKNEINARVGYFKLGINLKTETPSVPQLRKAVEEVIAKDEYTFNVNRLSAEFKQYHPGYILARQVARLLQPSMAAVRQVQREEASIY